MADVSAEGGVHPQLHTEAPSGIIYSGVVSAADSINQSWDEFAQPDGRASVYGFNSQSNVIQLTLNSGGAIYTDLSEWCMDFTLDGSNCTYSDGIGDDNASTGEYYMVPSEGAASLFSRLEVKHSGGMVIDDIDNFNRIQSVIDMAMFSAEQRQSPEMEMEGYGAEMTRKRVIPGSDITNPVFSTLKWYLRLKIRVGALGTGAIWPTSAMGPIIIRLTLANPSQFMYVLRGLSSMVGTRDNNGPISALLYGEWRMAHFGNGGADAYLLSGLPTEPTSPYASDVNTMLVRATSVTINWDMRITDVRFTIPWRRVRTLIYQTLILAIQRLDNNKHQGVVLPYNTYESNLTSWGGTNRLNQTLQLGSGSARHVWTIFGRSDNVSSQQHDTLKEWLYCLNAYWPGPHPNMPNNSESPSAYGTLFGTQPSQTNVWVTGYGYQIGAERYPKNSFEFARENNPPYSVNMSRVLAEVRRCFPYPGSGTSMFTRTNFGGWAVAFPDWLYNFYDPVVSSGNGGFYLSTVTCPVGPGNLWGVWEDTYMRDALGGATGSGLHPAGVWDQTAVAGGINGAALARALHDDGHRFTGYWEDNMWVRGLDSYSNAVSGTVSPVKYRAFEHTSRKPHFLMCQRLARSKQNSFYTGPTVTSGSLPLILTADMNTAVPANIPMTAFTAVSYDRLLLVLVGGNVARIN